MYSTSRSFHTACLRLTIQTADRHTILRFTPTHAANVHRLRARSALQVRSSRSIHSGLPRELRLLRNSDKREPLKKAEDHDTLTSRAAQFAKENAAAGHAAAQGKSTNTAVSQTPKKTLWQKVKDEAVHYWHGTKLLGMEIRISSKLLKKLLRGKSLTRREARQLRRTTSDILRLVPFAVFVLVPFMELLLPVALKLFPNMLPSTFVNKSREEEKKRKLLKVRLEMARFLQETIAESGFPGSDSEKAAKEFADFFRKIRITGEQATTKDLLNVAKRFEDELTLDNLSRPQLVSMCRYMNINAFGTDNFLRFQIRNRMRQIKADDRAIQAEGIEAMTLQEINVACAARGIRTIGTSSDRLRDELAQWLDLHLNHHVPSTLLILSRAFSFTDHMTTEEALRATFNSLPDNLVNETELQVLELVGATTYKQKMDVLEQQQELIDDESEQEEKEEQARRDAEEAEKQRMEQETRDKEAAARDVFAPDEKDKMKQKLKEKSELQQKDDLLSQEEQQELHEALDKLQSKVDVLEERAQLNEIKFHHEDYKDLIEQLKEATHRDADKATMRLGKKLEKMLVDIDEELDAIEKEQKEKDQQAEETTKTKEQKSSSS